MCWLAARIPVGGANNSEYLSFGNGTIRQATYLCKCDWGANLHIFVAMIRKRGAVSDWKIYIIVLRSAKVKEFNQVSNAHTAFSVLENRFWVYKLKFSTSMNKSARLRITVPQWYKCGWGSAIRVRGIDPTCSWTENICCWNWHFGRRKAFIDHQPVSTSGCSGLNERSLKCSSSWVQSRIEANHQDNSEWG